MKKITAFLTFAVCVLAIGHAFAGRSILQYGAGINGSAITPQKADVTGNAFTVGTSTFAVSGGQVGILTATPAYPLDVRGNIATNGTFIANNTGTGVYVSSFTGNNGAYTLDIYSGNNGVLGMHLFTPGAYPLGFSTNGAADEIDLQTEGGLLFYARTIAQLQAIVPIAAGEQFYCSNCTPAKMVISTGTSAGNFADPAGGVFK